MEALYDCDELDEYIDEHAAEFASYEAGSEQQLGWTAVHMQYVALVEAQIEEHLGELGIGSEGLYALLSEAAGGDPRADTFLERLLGMGDHDHFCAAMRDGDGRNPNPNPDPDPDPSPNRPNANPKPRPNPNRDPDPDPKPKPKPKPKPNPNPHPNLTLTLSP